MHKSIHSRTTPRLLLISLAVILFVIIAVRVLLLGKGAYFFPDEFRYNSSLNAAQLLLQGSIKEFCASLASTDGRPGDAVLRLFPALLQRAWLANGGPYVLTPESALIPMIFNYVVVTLAAWVFYRICRQLALSSGLSLLASLLYACLVNTNVYLRHLVPYDSAMLLMLVLINYVLTIRQRGATFSVWQYAAIGFASALLVTIYPGYYMAPFIVLAVLTDWLHPLRFLQTHWQRIGAYVVGGVSVIGIFEAITRIGHASYVRRSYDLAHTIDQGSPEESFTFLFKYLFQVEGLLGYTLAVGLGIYLLIVIKNIAGNQWRYLGELSDRNKLLLVSCLFFLLHASVGFFLHRLVFYGRLLHPFMPFLVLVVVLVVEQVQHVVIQNVLTIGLAIISTFSFGQFMSDYIEVQYPIDVMARFQLDQRDQKRIQRDYQVATVSSMHYPLPEPGIANNHTLLPPQQPVELLNFLYPFPLRPVAGIKLGGRVIFDCQHAINFRAYPFEGYSIAERKLLPTLQLRMQVRTFFQHL